MAVRRHWKRRLNQHLILRGSRDFASLEDHDRFVVEVLRAAAMDNYHCPLSGVSVVHAVGILVFALERA